MADKQEENNALLDLQRSFLDSYAAKDKNVSDKAWLRAELERHLPEASTEELDKDCEEIIGSLSAMEASKASLEEATQKGRSTEGWFGDQLKTAVSGASVAQAANYLSGIDSAVEQANNTLAGIIQKYGQCKNLDGFLAEGYHAETFNIDAAVTGSDFKAIAKESTGKNSMDVGVYDSNDNLVGRNQVKYYKDAQATDQALGTKYRGQKQVVPSEQVDEIRKTRPNATDRISADGAESIPLSKAEAKKMQEQAQSGKWEGLDWDHVQTKHLLQGLGRQTMQAGLFGAVIGAGVEVVSAKMSGKEVKTSEVVKTAIETGVDSGAKTALAGAMTVGVRKGVISAIPKATSAGVIAGAAFIAVENVKHLWKLGIGKISAAECMDRMERTTVCGVTGLICAGKGALIGAKVGSLVGPVGTAIGGVVGGTVGYMAGSEIGKSIVKARRTFTRTAVTVAKKAWGSATKLAGGIRDSVKAGWTAFKAAFA